MSYGKKLNELERHVERFGVDEDFYAELYALACKLSEKYPIGNDDLKDVLYRFQENERSFKELMNACRMHIKKYSYKSNDDTITSDSCNDCSKVL